MLSKNSESAIENLFTLEEDLIRAAAAFNLKLPRSASGIRSHLKSVPRPLITSINDNLENLLTNFATCSSEGIDPWDDREFLRLSMRNLGLSFPSDYLDRAIHDDLIEGFDMNRFQIFRNMRYMEMINYSLMEVLSFEWPMLYDRADAVTQKMISFCDEILWQTNRTIPFAVPTHYIRETRSQRRAFFEIDFKYLAPLFRGPGQPGGLLGSFRARPVTLEKNVADSLSFA